MTQGVLIGKDKCSWGMEDTGDRWLRTCGLGHHNYYGDKWQTVKHTCDITSPLNGDICFNWLWVMTYPHTTEQSPPEQVATRTVVTTRAVGIRAVATRSQQSWSHEHRRNQSSRNQRSRNQNQKSQSDQSQSDQSKSELSQSELSQSEMSPTKLITSTPSLWQCIFMSSTIWHTDNPTWSPLPFHPMTTFLSSTRCVNVCMMHGNVRSCTLKIN